MGQADVINFDVVMLLVGTNDISPRYNPPLQVSEIVNMMEVLKQEIQKRNPDCEVRFMELVPRYCDYVPWAKEEVIRRVRALHQEMLTRPFLHQKSQPLLRIHRLFLSHGIPLEAYFSPDHLHLSILGKEKLADFLTNVVRFL